MTLELTPARGRPTDYRPIYAAQAQKLVDQGFADYEIADFFEVSLKTLFNWKTQHDDFLPPQQLSTKADDRVERSMFQCALGYYYTARKPLVVNGTVEVVEYQEYVPASTTAQIFWLKNKRPQEWRDVRDMRHSIDFAGAESADQIVDIVRKKLGDAVASTLSALIDDAPPMIEGQVVDEQVSD